MLELKDRLIVALDAETLVKAESLVNRLFPLVKIFKVGSQLFTACGPEIIRFINKRGGKVFLDLKFCDIPNTVIKAIEAAKDLGVYMLTVHTFGASREMLRAAVAAAKGENKPFIIGVTLLTSLDKNILSEFGIRRLLTNEVIALAKMAKEEGLDGIVCSPQEIQYIRRRKNIFGEKFIIVTPGVRPKSYSLHEHQRVMTPSEAIKKGADYVVIGRPIIESNNPHEAAKKILGEIEETIKLSEVALIRTSAKATLTEFRFYAPVAKKVSVAGSFNNWNIKEYPAKKDSKGSWTARVSLKPGRYEYKFFVDGSWIRDADSPKKTIAKPKKQSLFIKIKK